MDQIAANSSGTIRVLLLLLSVLFLFCLGVHVCVSQPNVITPPCIAPVCYDISGDCDISALMLSLVLAVYENHDCILGNTNLFNTLYTGTPSLAPRSQVGNLNIQTRWHCRRSALTTSDQLLIFLC